MRRADCILKKDIAASVCMFGRLNDPCKGLNFTDFAHDPPCLWRCGEFSYCKGPGMTSFFLIYLRTHST